MRQTAGVLFGRALTQFVIIFILVRLVRDTSVRMMYPYLPEYAQGLGITLTAVGALLTIRTTMILLAPYFGHIADRAGQRRLMMIGFALQAAGLFVFAQAEGFALAAVAILLLGLSDGILLPLMQAYVSEHAPPARRGWALASVEYSWAITGIIVLPIIGWLIATGGWQLPFQIVGLASLGAILLFVFLLPNDAPRVSTERRSLLSQTRDILHDRSATGTIVTYALIFVAVETFFLTWGAHLESNFGLGPAQIGRIAAIIGIAELAGSFIASQVVDRTGKRRGAMVGIALFLVMLALMPVLNQSLLTLIAGLVLVSVCLEYTVVATIPLLGQQRPANRATVLAMGAMATAASRGVTDVTATWLLENTGYLVALSYAFVALAVGLVVLWRWVEERRET